MGLAVKYDVQSNLRYMKSKIKQISSLPPTGFNLGKVLYECDNGSTESRVYLYNSKNVSKRPLTSADMWADKINSLTARINACRTEVAFRGLERELRHIPEEKMKLASHLPSALKMRAEYCVNAYLKDARFRNLWSRDGILRIRNMYYVRTRDLKVKNSHDGFPRMLSPKIASAKSKYVVVDSGRQFEMSVYKLQMQSGLPCSEAIFEQFENEVKSVHPKSFSESIELRLIMERRAAVTYRQYQANIDFRRQWSSAGINTLYKKYLMSELPEEISRVRFGKRKKGVDIRWTRLNPGQRPVRG